MATHEFEQLLKKSDHFRDVINTHRQATAEILAAFINELVLDGKLSHTDVDRILAIVTTTGGPSLAAEKGLIAARIRDTLKGIA